MGGGCIICDDKGAIIVAKADYYGETTNFIAEAKALLQGLDICKYNEFNDGDIEVDSLMLVQVIEKKVGAPWATAYEIGRLLLFYNS